MCDISFEVVDSTGSLG